MNNYTKLSDNELINLLRGSDHVAFTEIYDRYYYLLFTHAYKKLRDEDEAKDLIQELFTSLWHKRENAITTYNLAGYLYTAVRNRTLDFFSHQEVSSKYIASLTDYINGGHVANTDHLIREKEFQAYIDKEIEALPPMMKQIFKLSKIDHLTHTEIAEKLGTNENNVSKQLTTAVKILKNKLGLAFYIYLFLNS